ncbi:hypothetical protein B0F90DRAFT_1784142 [Multifurca ochricompacta]|uniref:Uncharacterized protein n=1 Tax=Multifurca ochricompacta TaxID=376703 RepID=A0AAD4QEN3_9AGAM|nr:hypothetical protein B0F90DRAFT_1784142 [Multifurca ochricompacta]
MLYAYSPPPSTEPATTISGYFGTNPTYLSMVPPPVAGPDVKKVRLVAQFGQGLVLT